MTFSLEPLTFEKMVTLTLDDLHGRPDWALEAIELCGDLAPWGLRPEVYACAGLKWFRPEIPAKLGSCWILQVILLGKENEPANNSIFRPAVILPLIWRKGTERDPRLSDGLQELAELIVGYGEEIGNTKDWTLHLDLENVPQAFHSISIDKSLWQSAWAALYAGLDLAVHGFEPDNTVFASGSWQHGLHEIVGLEQKAAVVQEWCQGKPWTLYTSNQHKLPQLAGGKIKALEPNRDRQQALWYYLADLRQKPGEKEEELFDAYYCGLKGTNRKDAFYMDTLVPFLEAKHRQQRPNLATKYQGRTLVEWISNGREWIILSAQLFQPSRIILLASKEYEHELGEARRFLQKNFPGTEIAASMPGVSLQSDDTYQMVTQYVARRLEAYLSEPMILDVTLCDTRKSLALMDFRYKHTEAERELLYWNGRCDGEGNLLPTTVLAEIL